jgi:hypothetical protein
MRLKAVVSLLGWVIVFMHIFHSNRINDIVSPKKQWLQGLGYEVEGCGIAPWLFLSLCKSARDDQKVTCR